MADLPREIILHPTPRPSFGIWFRSYEGMLDTRVLSHRTVAEKDKAAKLTKEGRKKRYPAGYEVIVDTQRATKLIPKSWIVYSQI